MTIKEIQQEIVDELSMFEDPMERMEYVVDLGKSLPLIDEKYKTEDFLIKGCQSNLWLFGEEKNGKVIFTADAAAIIPKGIIAILTRVFSNQKAMEILQDDTQQFIKAAGLDEFFQMTRSNGLEQMIKQIKMYALAFQSQQE